MTIEYLIVPSITGNHDIQAIRAALGALPGVLLVTVSLPDRRVRVEHDGRTSIEELLRALNQAGYAQVALLA